MRSTAATPSRSDITRVGCIGLGDMGGAIATRIIDAGFATVLWARRPDVLSAFSGPHVETAQTPAELAAAVDMISISVWDDRALRDVIYGPDRILAGCRPGTVIAVHSTVQPTTCREIERAAGKQGVVVLDAPVSGGRAAALAGQLVAAVGGDEVTLQRSRPVLECFADHVIHVGPVGTGQLTKLVNNCVLAANTALADDALSLAATFGVNCEAMAEVLRHGSGRSFGLEVAVSSRTSAQVREQTASALNKDVQSLTVEAAPRVCAQVPLLTSAAREAVQRLTMPPGWTR